MISFTPILSLLKKHLFWRFIGFISSIVGLFCYALSSSFKLLYGDWNLLKFFLYGLGSFIICSFVLLAKTWQLSRLMLKAHMGFLVLMFTSVYSFFYEKSVTAKLDVFGLISCAAFALLFFSLSRQTNLGFEVDLLSFFLGSVTVQLMKINLILAFLGGGFCYFLIILRYSLDATVRDHVTVEVDTSNRLEIAADHSSNTDYDNHHQELPSLRKRNSVTTVPDKVYIRNTLEFHPTTTNAVTFIEGEFREQMLKEIKEFHFSNPEDEARKIVSAMKIQHAFRNYRTRKMTEAANFIQGNFDAWKIRKESLYLHQQAVKIQAAFRGFQVRKNYNKTNWSVKIIDNEIMRWRFKRRGFRGLHVNYVQKLEDHAMLRSKKAQ